MGDRTSSQFCDGMATNVSECRPIYPCSAICCDYCRDNWNVCCFEVHRTAALGCVGTQRYVPDAVGDALPVGCLQYSMTPSNGIDTVVKGVPTAEPLAPSNPTYASGATCSIRPDDPCAFPTNMDI